MLKGYIMTRFKEFLGQELNENTKMKAPEYFVDDESMMDDVYNELIELGLEYDRDFEFEGDIITLKKKKTKKDAIKLLKSYDFVKA